MDTLTKQVEDITAEDYQLFRRLVYEKSGINLGDHKIQLVRARLGKLIRRGGFRSYREYYQHVQADTSGAELGRLLDAISTNTTHLFREQHHFDRLHGIIRDWVGNASWVRGRSALRIWSAGCSSGDESYSIAMTAHDALQDHSGVELKILATDISTQMLQRASRGLFDVHRLGTVPALYRQRYFDSSPGSQDGGGRRIVPEVRQLIKFARFNLMTPVFPFRHGFDVIFCRNVMIYFDPPTQQTLVNKFAQHLHAGGYLMIGHSESLNNLKHPLNYVEPTIYRRCG
jgi:chemotaxis protein methyltransferase CheR